MVPLSGQLIDFYSDECLGASAIMRFTCGDFTPQNGNCGIVEVVYAREHATQEFSASFNDGWGKSAKVLTLSGFDLDAE